VSQERDGKILITGANGFVGGALLQALLERGSGELVAAVRRADAHLPDDPRVNRLVFSLAPDFSWAQGLAGVSTVIHAAARVHMMDDQSADPLSEFRKVNVAGTLTLARQAAQAGVKRFIFISSIKVNGEGTPPSSAYTANDTPMPADPYGISKHEAEQGLLELAAATGMDVVIIRPPLVYGPGVRANFLSMMRWLDKGVPLPLGAINNRRSLVALGNLVDLVVTCIEHPAAANQVFLVSDGEDLSTSDLLRRMAQALGRPARLLPVPESLLRAGAGLLGKQAFAQRLFGSLQVDISKTRSLLGWEPPLAVNDALKLAARHFQEHQDK
jgi:UDP-glucose 4-epimerase